MSDSLDLVVVGLGYVGLPLASQALRCGVRVAGFDLNDAVVEGLNAGRSHIDDLSDEDHLELQKAIRAELDKLVATLNGLHL